MALKLHSGLFKHPVTFRAATKTRNSQGEMITSYADAFSTFAHVDNVSQFRSTQPFGTDLTGTKEFYLRWSQNAATLTKDHLIVYKGLQWTIHQLKTLNEEEKYIRISAKAHG